MTDAEALADNTPVIVKTKNITATELAAVTAVVRGMLSEEHDSLRVESQAPPSRWERSQRDFRGEVSPATQTWVP